jgi:signal transduction histidine kinase/HPt (histidine-containing phosphotransfer) domain-containing protein
MLVQPQAPGPGRTRGPASLWLAVLATLALLAFFSLGAAIWVGGAQLDRAARDSEEGLVRLALDDVLHTLAQNTRDYCYWDEAAEAAVITNDTDWIDRNIGPLLFDSWGTEYVVVVEPDGRTLYALVDGKRVDLTAEATLGPDLFRVMAEAAVADGVPVPATGIVSWGDDLIAIAAASFQPWGNFDLLAHPDFRPVYLVVGQRIDETLLTSLRDEYDLASPRLALDGLHDGEHGAAMLSPVGAIVGQIAWRPDLPGSRQVKAVAPAAGLLGLLFLGFSAFAFDNIRRSMRQLAAGNRALNEKVEEQRRLTDELLLAKEAAEAGNRAKSEFLATISHEIRTPLNGILGMTGLLLDGELADAERRFANTIHTSAEALLAIINDILDFSKIEAGRLDLEDRAFDLEALLGGVTDLFAAKLQAGQVTLTHAVAPGAAGGYLGDANRLRQVLVNLVGNAAKFTERGSILVAASGVGEDGPDAGLRFSVADTGIGIPEAHWPHLFTMFTQGDASTSRRYGGTGLGLAICKQIVEQMGGEIGFESREGEGSTFWFVVPLPRAAAPQAIAPDTASVSAAEEHRAVPGGLRDGWDERSSMGQGGSAAGATRSEFTSAGVEAPVVDPEVELDLRQGLGSDVYDRLAASFVARIGGATGALQARLDWGDVGAARQDARDLAGEASNLGFARLGARLGELERACDRDVGVVRSSLARVNDAVAEVVALRGGASAGMAA